MKILDRYIDQLIEQSTPEAPVWNIEKIREGSKSTWNRVLPAFTLSRLYSFGS